MKFKIISHTDGDGNNNSIDLKYVLCIYRDKTRERERLVCSRGGGATVLMNCPQRSSAQQLAMMLAVTRPRSLKLVSWQQIHVTLLWQQSW